MYRKVSNILVVLGLLFLLNTIFGRYLVLPGYLASLKAGGSTLEGASQIASTGKIIRYLLWAYSFKLGIYFIILGATFRTEISSKRRWVIAIGGLVYIAFAYIPLPEPGSIIYGVSGGLMTILMIFIFFRWANERGQLPPSQQTASDYRMIGYFFFGMATYTLCPLMGVKTFALSPERMIEYGLQAEAASFAFHILIELVLGWTFTSLSFRKEFYNDERKQENP